MNASVTTDQNGNRDESAAKANNATNKSMMIVMPLMSLFIGYSYPAALSLYWLVQGLFWHRPGRHFTRPVPEDL